MIGEEDQQTRALHELWSMMIHVLRSPPLPFSFPAISLSSPSSSSPLQRRPRISPAAFGALFIGISIALMLFGIVTFVIGVVLMPLVVMLVLLFCFAGVVSRLWEIGRSILGAASGSNKVAPVWNYSS